MINNNKKQNLKTIGETAKQANVSTRTLRYYEEIGLLEPVSKTEKGHRLYNDFHIKLLNDIQQLSLLGFSLDEIKKIMMLKKIFFTQNGDEKQFSKDEVPFEENELIQIKNKTINIINTIDEQRNLLKRLDGFLERFLH